MRLAEHRVFSQNAETHFPTSYAPVSRPTSHPTRLYLSGTAASRSARKRKVEKGVCLMCLGGPNPSYLLHPPALRRKRCADDLWRTTGPGRDPHPAGAPQRRLRKRLPRTLSAAALVRTRDDLVLNNNTTTSIMRCQVKTNKNKNTFHTRSNTTTPIHASSHPFPHGRSASSHISPQRCVKRSPQIRISLAGKKRARNVCPRALRSVFVRFPANGG